ncbi:hypothetical protein Q9Q95_14895 [Sphingomonas sp. DG1-23]|uniref:hypothetical protein n=1 Tax=Sphingomonas sp. DG1-23 TaxID=3068316 RepID=UPI00273F0626|nr:hypothetical protein [Sphingomonas sp. DG1-23]MDP5280214.1 hypothetical protein [Sphingomonas sp. DG1-23]
MASNKTKSAPRKQQRKADDSRSTGKALAIGTLSIGAALGAIAAGVFGLRKLAARGGAGHVPTDLMGDTHPGPEDRAPVDFRPDPTAPIPSSERDAFRPALAGAAAPTLVKGQARENARLDAAPS